MRAKEGGSHVQDGFPNRNRSGGVAGRSGFHWLYPDHYHLRRTWLNKYDAPVSNSPETQTIFLKGEDGMKVASRLVCLLLLITSTLLQAQNKHRTFGPLFWSGSLPAGTYTPGIGVYLGHSKIDTSIRVLELDFDTLVAPTSDGNSPCQAALVWIQDANTGQVGGDFMSLNSGHDAVGSTTLDLRGHAHTTFPAGAKLQLVFEAANSNCIFTTAGNLTVQYVATPVER